MYTAGCRQPLRPSGPSPVDVDEVFHSGSDDDYYDNPNERRRRYEIQGQRFLRGKPLTIISAQLRGPFDKGSGWQNPWLGKTKASRRIKGAIAAPSAHVTSLSQANNGAAHVPDSTSKLEGLEFGRVSATLAPSMTDVLTRPNPTHSSSPVASGLRGSVINGYMESDAWSRVHAWRVDVIMKTEPVLGMRAVTTAAVKNPAQHTSRGKRPASSELLRNALAKKSRINRPDLSAGEPWSTAVHVRTPSTIRRLVSDPFFSTPDDRPPKDSRVSLDSSSRAALDGSVAGQTSTSKALQKQLACSTKSVENNSFSTPPQILVDEVEKVNFASVTPVGPRPPVNNLDSDAEYNTSIQRQTPLRPNVTKINVVTNSAQARVETQATKETGWRGPPLTTSKVPVSSPLEFCTQADESFQYRSKGPSIDNRRALGDDTRKADDQEQASRSSSSTGTTSIDTEAGDDTTPEEPDKVSKEPCFPNISADIIISAQSEDALDSKTSTADTSIMAEEGADTTGALVDGPTLVPTSSASSHQQSTHEPPSLSGKGSRTEEHVTQKATLDGVDALPELNAKLEPYTPPNRLLELPSQAPPVDPGPGMTIAQIHDHQNVQLEEDTDAAVEPAVLPTLSADSAVMVKRGSEVKAQNQHSLPDQGATVKSTTEAEPDSILPGPQQQSPWADEVMNVTEQTAHTETRRPTPQTPIQETVRFGGSKPPSQTSFAAISARQSPWAEEIILPGLSEAAADTPSGPLADYSGQSPGASYSPRITARTASQNPWVSDGSPQEANYLSTGNPRPHYPLSPHQLRGRGEVTPPPAFHTNMLKHSPVRPTVGTVMAEIPPKPHLPSTPTQQSSLPTPDLTSSIKSFRDFMSPSPEPRRRSRLILSFQDCGIDKLHRRKSALCRSRKDRGKRAHLRVSFSLPDEELNSSPATDADADETLYGAELPSREAKSPSLVRKASSWAPHRRASSPPLELSQSELPAEGTRFSKFFRTQARKGPQVRHGRNHTPLLPSASQQTCGSPQADAMAEAFMEADRTRSEQGTRVDSAKSSGDEEEEHSHETEEQLVEDEEAQEIDDVTDVLANLGDYLTSFDVDADLDKARREEQKPGKPQELVLGFSSKQDQMEIMGAGIWD